MQALRQKNEAKNEAKKPRAASSLARAKGAASHVQGRQPSANIRGDVRFRRALAQKVSSSTPSKAYIAPLYSSEPSFRRIV